MARAAESMSVYMLWVGFDNGIRTLFFDTSKHLEENNVQFHSHELPDKGMCFPPNDGTGICQIL